MLCYTVNVEWLRDNWLKLHLAISPHGTLGVTWLLVFSVGAGQWWEDRASLEATRQVVPLGGIVYGSGILVLEVAFRMLWALAQRQKDIERARQEGRQEGREEGREQALRDPLDRGVDLPPELLKEIERAPGGRNHSTRTGEGS